MRSEDSTTPDPVELTRRMFEAASRHDLDALMGLYAPDAVYDADHAGLGTSFEGTAAIRGFVEEWWGTFADHLTEVQEIVDLGQGVAFARVREAGRPVGGDGHVEQLRGWVLLGTQGKIERVEPYFDSDEARAAAERLAESRG
jgi:ketosteroid isomerase-like protein